MAYSIIQYTATGLTNTYAINFALGFNNRNEVTCQVNNEVDGLSAPVYRSLTWINDGLVTVDGVLLTAGWPVVFKRTVTKTTLIHDYSNGEAIEESNLDESNKQNLMAIHEVLDGRLTSALQQDLDMGTHKITNLVDGINPQDAVTFSQLNGVTGGAGNGAYLDVSGSQVQDDVLLWNTGTVKFIRRSLAYLNTQLGAAPLASPTFTGTPAAPTAAQGTSTTQLATTAFVQGVFGGGQFAALRNAIINGAMGISQQNGTSSVALTTSVSYGSCDRWAAAQGGTAAGTIAQVIGNAPPGLRYCARVGRNAAATSTNVIQLQQAITTDNSVRFAGAPATLSFWAKAGANYSGGNLTANVYSGTGIDQSAANLAGAWTGTTTPITSSQAITTTWTRYSFTGTIPANCTQLGAYIAYTPSGTAGADDNIYITGVQLETGSVATPFENVPDLDIQRCLKHAESGTIAGVAYGSSGSVIQRSMIYFKAKKFISPTMSFAYVSGTSQTPTVAANAIDGCWVAWPSFTVAGQETVCTYFARAEL